MTTVGILDDFVGGVFKIRAERIIDVVEFVALWPEAERRAQFTHLTVRESGVHEDSVVAIHFLCKLNCIGEHVAREQARIVRAFSRLLEQRFGSSFFESDVSTPVYVIL